MSWSARGFIKRVMMRAMSLRSGIRMVSCEHALERMFEYLDGELDGVSEREIREHFRICKECYPKLRFEEAFLAALQRARDGARAPESVRSKILEALKSEGPTRT